MKGSLLICFFIIFLVEPAISATSELNWIGHWKGEGKREQLLKEVKKEFGFLYPDVNVAMTFNKDLAAEGSNYKWKVAQTIVDMIQSGEVKYDVVFLGVAVYNHVADLLDDPYWGEKHLVDFSEVDGFLESQKPFILKIPHYKKQTGGIFVGPFVEGFIACPWYNTKVAEKIGVTILERNMDIDTFLSYAKRLHEYNSSNGTSISFFSMCSFNRIESLFEYIFRSQFDDPQLAIAEEYSSRKKDAFLKSLLIFEQLSKYQPIFNPDWKDLAWSDWEKRFLNGSSLFIITGTYMYNSLFSLDPEKALNVIPIQPPHVKQNNGMVGDYMNVFAVMKNAPNKENAINLLKLWSEPKIGEKWINYTRNPTGIKGHLSDAAGFEAGSDPYSAFIHDMSEKYGHLPTRNFRKPTLIFGKDSPLSANAFRTNLTRILEGKLTAKKFYSDITALMEDYHSNLNTP
jgi:hypothetical protein